MNLRILTTLGLALAIVVLVPATSALAQTTVVQPAPAPPPPPSSTVVVPTPRQAAVTTESGGPNTALISTGLVSFGIAYGASVIVASQSEHPGDKHLFVPIAGPWIDLANRGRCNVNNTSCDGETTNKVLLVIDGVVQGAGALAVIGGLLSTGGSSHATTVSQTGVHFTPVSYGSGSPGIAAFGNF